MHTVANIALLLALAACSSVQPPDLAVSTPGTVSVIPKPQRLTLRSGNFALSSITPIHAEGDFAAVGTWMADYLRPATGFSFPVVRDDKLVRGAITIRHNAGLASTLGTEGYRLEISSASILIEAAAPAGAFYGVQSVRQLLPSQIYREAKVSGVAWNAPALLIEDSPRFRWRGSHLDVSRHFMPKEFVKKHIDLLAMHKMNSFHWHLTDDQGWRIQIMKYPLLTEVGGWRKETLIGRMRGNATATYDGKPHGGFYTQDDIREIVAYAQARFINVVPEIEMPGHAQAVIAAYPRLASTDSVVEVRKVWGVSQNLLNPSDSTIAFMKDVLDEVLALFPGPFIHIGGDEAVKNEWRVHPIARARMQKEGLTTEAQLQSWFIRQFDQYLAQKGRRLVGWDEILEGGLAENALVMSWRGVAGGIAAAREGHDVIMAPNSHTYFDHLQSRDPTEPLSIGGFLPIDSVYAYEPIPAQLEPQFVKHILGAQAQLWTEYMPNAKHVEYMAYPRMCALAEVVWSPREVRNFADFTTRLSTHLRRLDALDVNYRKSR